MKRRHKAETGLREPWNRAETVAYLSQSFDARTREAIAKRLDYDEPIRAGTSWDRLVIGGVPIPEDRALYALLTDRRVLVVDSASPERKAGISIRIRALRIGGLLKRTGSSPQGDSKSGFSFHSVRFDEITKVRRVHRNRQLRTTMWTTSGGVKWKVKWPPPPQSRSDKKFTMLFQGEVTKRTWRRRTQRTSP